MNYLHPRTALIAEAEALSRHAVTLTERKQAAYHAWFLSDPFARPTFYQGLQDVGFYVASYRLSPAGKAAIAAPWKEARSHA